MKALRVYIAGPMTGLPESNYPAFNAMAARLRALGHHVENPAENPEPACKSWRGYMRMAIAQLVTCDAVALLPGWGASKGAVIEAQLARGLHLNIYEAETLATEGPHG
ncbi:DUF4406 domain-containing protein [Variovorax paradoxus]|uniref:DUF4406 domain-containing protein n=1 Tax=Variovorax paradoxus TaxID=34073 RepID=A0A0H2LY48_VARPD|nr:DUF4406 domain-containing protein [Variovorax paradoxus]KLN54691.1 hypothetical protein VPARA_39950 [Variovorax paradoxus]